MYGTGSSQEALTEYRIGTGAFRIESMTMNARHTHSLTHFVPLFVTAFGGWMTFHFVNSGTLYVAPGMIVAGLIAYGGMLVAFHTDTTRDLRTTYPVVRTSERFSTIVPSRNLARFSAGPAFNAMDIAAGD